MFPSAAVNRELGLAVLVLVLTLPVTASCGTSATAFVPVSEPDTPPSATPIGHRTTVVLDKRLAETTYATPRSYPGGKDGRGPYVIMTGAGFGRSIEARLGRMFSNYTVATSVPAAITPSSGTPQPELVIVPRLARVEVSDDGAGAGATVDARILILSGVGSAMDTFEVSGKGSSDERRGGEASGDADLDRLRSAIEVAYADALAQMDERLRSHRALRAITERKTTDMVKHYAVRYQAALECAAITKRSIADIDARFGLDVPEVRARMRVFRQKVADSDRLAIFLIGCSDDPRPPEEILAVQLAAVDDQIRLGELEEAEAILRPLVEVAPNEPEIAAARAALEDAVVQKRRAERDAREAEERRVAEALAAREAAEREIREAEERERNAIAAQKHIAAARGHLKARRFEAAFESAIAASDLMPTSSPEVIEIINVVDAWRAEQLEKQRVAEAARLERERIVEEARRRRERDAIKRAVPNMIRKCQTASRLLEQAIAAERQAAVSGNPQRVTNAVKARDRATSTFYDAQQKIRAAIAVYQSAGEHNAAQAVYADARRPCRL